MAWMAWTLPTAIFFAGIALALTAMTLAELKWPTTERRGLLPIATTRGDRFFISLLSVAWLHLAWLGLTDLSLVFASLLAIGLTAFIMRWG